MLSLRATFKRNYWMMRHAFPMSSIFSNVLSGIYAVVFAFLMYHFMFKGEMDSKFAEYAGSSDYITYSVLGSILYIVSISVLMTVSRALISELRQGTLETLFLTPSSRLGYFWGCLLYGMLLVGIEFVAMIGSSLFFGLDLSAVNIPAVIGCLLLIMVSFFSQALVLGAIMMLFRDTYISQNTLILITNLLAGVSFPIQYLPEWVQPLCYTMPLTFGLNIFRRTVMEGAGLFTNWQDLTGLIVLTAVYYVVGTIWVRNIEKNLLEKYQD